MTFASSKTGWAALTLAAGITEGPVGSSLYTLQVGDDVMVNGRKKYYEILQTGVQL